MSAAGFRLLAPRQLPNPPAWLTGRDDELGALDQMLAVPGRRPLIVVISGAPGAGKTALAAWWLHQHQMRFADGQMYARLRGPHGLGETPPEILGRWLRALGIPTVSVPAGQADRVTLWQSVTTGRRLAVMIDDAPSAAAVAALQPGPGPALVVVTSRRMLAAGLAGGSGQLRLRPLNRAAAMTLLARQLDEAQASCGTATVRELARTGGGLPLALRCVARLAASSGPPLNSLAAGIRAEEAWLAAGGVPRAEARVRAVIEAACQQLQAATARAFRLLALCPGPEVTIGLAATVLDTGPAPARKLLEELVTAGLIERAACGWWRFHDLAYFHAQEQAQRMESGSVIRVVTSRILSWYVGAAIGAHAELPGSGHAQPITHTRQDGDYASPAWTERHQPAMVAALRAAVARGDHAAAARLAGVLWPLLAWHGCYAEELAVVRLGVRAARACGDAQSEARLLTGTGFALRQLGRAGEAAAPLRGAARIWLELGFDDQLAATLRELGRISAARGRQAEAMRYFTQAVRLGQRGGRPPS